MKTSKASSQARDTKVIAAIGAHFTGATTFTFGGVDYKAKGIQQLLQTRIDLAAETDAAKAKWLTAAAAEQEKTTECETVLLALKSHLVTAYGKQSAIVADFGFTPKRRQPTAETAAKAVLKREATRKARGTRGKRERLKIKGVVPPEAPPATPTPPAAPAPATGGTAPAVTGGQ